MSWLDTHDRTECRRLFQAGTHTYREAEQKVLREKLERGWLPGRLTVVLR
jgi:hypothetical protein